MDPIGFLQFLFSDIIESLGQPTILIGNIVALCACIMLVVVGCCKKKKNALVAEIVESGFFAFSDGILGGTSGIVTNAMAILRNILCYFNRMNWPIKVALCAATLGFGVLFNSLGIIGILPLFGTCLYICFMDTQDELKFKIVFAITMPLWIAFDWYIHSYVGFICDVLCFAGALVAIARILHDRKLAQRAADDEEPEPTVDLEAANA